MEIKILKEAGYEEAIFGLSLNKNQPLTNMPGVAKRLAHFDGGHNKFLEHIELWIEVTAPRFWWQEADTYRLSSKNSESTMHTLTKRKIQQSDFSARIPESYLSFLNQKMEEGGLLAVKPFLPEGFLQKRMWKMSYKTLKNIVQQRKSHRLPEWNSFVKQIMKQVAHPYFLMDEEKINDYLQ